MNTTDLRRQAEQAENTPYKRVDVQSSVLLELLDGIATLTAENAALNKKVIGLEESVQELLSQRAKSGVILDSALRGERHPEEIASARYDAVRQLALKAQLAAAEPAAYLIDWPDEQDLGHYFAEDACDAARSRPLFLAPPQHAAVDPVFEFSDDELRRIISGQCIPEGARRGESNIDYVIRTYNAAVEKAGQAERLWRKAEKELDQLAKQHAARVPAAYIYAVGDKRALDFERYADAELSDGCIVTTLYE